jgi:hypothetical protein
MNMFYCYLLTNSSSYRWNIVILWFSRKTNGKCYLIGYWKNVFDMIVKVWFFPIYFYALRGWHHFPNTCQDLFLGGEGDIASTQNLLISFQPIICKLDYSHIIINNYCLHARWILYLYYLQIRWTSKVVHLRVVDSPLPRTSAKESNNCFIIPKK